MSIALAVFLLAVIVPVFFGRTRSAPVWLAIQAAALGWAGMLQHAHVSVHALGALGEILIVRATLAPWLLRRAMHRRGEPEGGLMPSNLFAWAIAVALIVLAFQFGAPAADDRHAMTLGAVAATVAVALLILSSNASPAAQLVAVLYMENALGLFETLLPQPWPLPVHLALGLIYLGTVGVGSWLIGEPHAGDGAATAPEGEIP